MNVVSLAIALALDYAYTGQLTASPIEKKGQPPNR
jgi:hypothetical protein